VRQLRFYVPIQFKVGNSYQIPETKARHMIQVLRLAVGAEFTLFNGDGNEYYASLIDVKKKSALVEILRIKSVDRESKLQIHLLQGLSKGERMDATIQKCVELGVNFIQPVSTKRSNLKLNESRMEKKQLHWQGIIESACEQSGRNIIPKLQFVNTFESVVGHYAPKKVLKLILHPLAEKTISQLSNSAQEEIVLLVGPEGGFSDDELELAVHSGFIPLSLGVRILRTETAAMATIAGIQAKWGDIA
jgi:16S rRNA (uracil1498-N3)-methyltransferase